jgi:hypothetical protein
MTTPARPGLKTTSDLRGQIAGAKAEATAAEKQRRDEDYAVKSSDKGLAVLASVPAESAASPESLKSYIKAQIAIEKAKPKGTSADLKGLQYLDRVIGDRTVASGDLAREVNAAREAAAAKLAGLTVTAPQKQKTADDLEASYKAYTDLIPEGDLKKLFEKDRSTITPRLIEQDLAILRQKLAAFPAQTVGAAPCPARTDLTQFVAKLEQEVDKLAHKAKCHLCPSVNGVDRTADAKALINAKVAALEQLAARADDSGLSPAEKIDYALAKSLNSLRTQNDENGKTAGKMIGVLICRKRPGGEIVHLYGYSGTLASNSRLADAEVIKIQRQLEIPDKIAAKQLEVATNQASVDSAERDVAAAVLGAKDKDPKGPEAKLVATSKSAAGALRDKQAKLAKELTALQGSLPPDLPALRGQLAAAQVRATQASVEDTALETSTAGSWVRSLPETGQLTSASGDTVSLEALNTGHDGTPHGVCAAPKMIQQAHAQNYEIVGMAEAWYGGGTNTHGELVASCTTCMKNVGFQFCGNTHV